VAGRKLPATDVGKVTPLTTILSVQTGRGRPRGPRGVQQKHRQLTAFRRAFLHPDELRGGLHRQRATPISPRVQTNPPHKGLYCSARDFRRDLAATPNKV